MAYYDSFTKKPQNKRDDWRDDEMTRRPARDEGRAVETERRYGEKKNYGDRNLMASAASLVSARITASAANLVSARTTVSAVSSASASSSAARIASVRPSAARVRNAATVLIVRSAVPRARSAAKSA